MPFEILAIRALSDIKRLATPLVVYPARVFNITHCITLKFERVLQLSLSQSSIVPLFFSHLHPLYYRFLSLLNCKHAQCKDQFSLYSIRSIFIAREPKMPRKISLPVKLGNHLAWMMNCVFLTIISP